MSTKQITPEMKYTSYTKFQSRQLELQTPRFHYSNNILPTPTLNVNMDQIFQQQRTNQLYQLQQQQNGQTYELAKRQEFHLQRYYQMKFREEKLQRL
eukprot:Pgem_evm1s686